MARAPLLLARANAQELQRQQQQGLGRQIISAEVQGHRFVAVGNTMYHSPKWQTFHDFLVPYLRSALGPAWVDAELPKPDGDRHPLMSWYQKLCLHQQTFVQPGKVSVGQKTGAVAALMHLSYDLYALKHNAELCERLVDRLRNPLTFQGALQEVSVAAMLLRAGFALAFEDEDDGSTTHVEFIATAKRTGKQYSVEVKRADAAQPRVNRLLSKALKKNAAHERVVFIELNEADTDVDMPPKPLKRALEQLRLLEREPLSATRPAAYVFVTNTPWQHGLDQTDQRTSVASYGFRIPEFRSDHQFTSLRQLVDAHQAHKDMHDLMKSIERHSSIPVTFDGATPEHAFDAMPSRLVVGERITVSDETGQFCAGVLEQGVVVEQWKAAQCVVKLDDGRRVLGRVPLTELEIDAWRAHPQTFFGVIDPNVREPARNALDWYYFFHESYKTTPKGRLLEFMKEAPDIDQLRGLDQTDLARTLCERLALRTMRDQERGAHILTRSKAPLASKAT
jgi:hypothetical protein